MLSKFLEDTMKWRLFDQTVNQVRQAFADLPSEQLNCIIDEAILSVRKDKRGGKKVRSRK